MLNKRGTEGPNWNSYDILYFLNSDDCILACSKAN